MTILFTSIPIRAQTATPPPAPTNVTISGPVYMGTPNVEVTEPLIYKLSVFRSDASQGSADGVIEAYTAETQIDKTGRFVFPNVPLQPGDLYVVTTQYGGITQGAIPTTWDGKTAPLELPITLWAGTNDPAKLVIAQNQQALSFVSPGVMRVLETVTIINQGDRFYRSDQKAPDGSQITATIPLPVGARAIAFNTLPTSRFFIAGDPNAPIVQDTKAILPNQPQDIIFSYQIPYAQGAPIDRDYLYPVLQLRITLPADSAIAASGLLFQTSRTTAQDTGRDLSVFTVDKPPLKDGKRLIYTLQGAARNREVAPVVSGFSPALALVAIVVIVLVVVGVLAVLRWRANHADT
jgi:hypothetical protein